MFEWLHLPLNTLLLNSLMIGLLQQGIDLGYRPRCVLVMLLDLRFIALMLRERCCLLGLSHRPRGLSCLLSLYLLCHPLLGRLKIVEGVWSLSSSRLINFGHILRTTIIHLILVVNCGILILFLRFLTLQIIKVKIKLWICLLLWNLNCLSLVPF